MILIHCSAYPASSKDRFNEINQLHKDREFDKSSKGFYVGYHVLLTGGKKYVAREETDIGSHCLDMNFVGQAGYLFPDKLSLNYHSLAICVDFNGDKEDIPAWALPMLKEQVEAWMKKYNIPLDKVRFHREFSKEGKTCPGTRITRKWVESFFKPLPPPPPTPAPAPPVPAVVDTPEVLRNKITLVETLISLFLELLSLLKKKQSTGSSLSMNDEIKLPAWYQSTAGPGISATLINTAGSALPLLNFMLQAKGIQILPADLNFWITILVFAYFAVMTAVGYVRAKVQLGRQVAALKGQLQSMGATPRV